ncbi:MAG: murein biosynthesis integral membrane protein MurJ [Thiohalomonadales bacterium]
MSSKLLKSTAVVSFMTLLSRFSGLARDVVFARIFGANAITDAFFIAFKLPNFLRRLFAEGAFSQAFVPVLTEYKTQREHEEVKLLVQKVSGTLGVFLFVLTAIGIIAAPLIIWVFAWGYHDLPEQSALTIHMLKITFPYIFFISMAAVATGILNSYGRFAIPAFTPVLLNICMIIATVWGAPYFDQPILALAWGVFFAGIVQLMFQLPAVRKLKLLGWPKWGGSDPGVRKIIRIMIPAIIGSSAQQINLVLDLAISSLLVGGSISWLYYADRLVEVPLGVFGIAIATVILPSLSARFAESDPESFNQTMEWAVRLTLVIGAPATVGLVMLSGPMISTMFEDGVHFDALDTQMTQYALAMYSIGLLGYMYVKVLAPGFFARQDTKTPMKYSLITIAIKMVLTATIAPILLYSGFAAAHLGLAFSTAVAALINAYLLYRGLRRDQVYSHLPGFKLMVLKVFIACVAMATVLSLVHFESSIWHAHHILQQIFDVLLWVLAGAVVYFFVLFIFRVDFKALIRQN